MILQTLNDYVDYLQDLIDNDPAVGELTPLIAFPHDDYSQVQIEKWDGVDPVYLTISNDVYYHSDINEYDEDDWDRVNFEKNDVKQNAIIINWC